MGYYSLEIEVKDNEGLPIKNVSITATPEAVGAVTDAQYDGDRQIYYFDKLRPGFFQLVLNRTGFSTINKRVQVHNKPTEISFTLAPEQLPFILRGDTQVAYQSQPELIGIIPAKQTESLTDSATGETIAQLLNRLGLITEGVSIADATSSESSVAVTGTLVVKRSQKLENSLENIKDNDLKELRESPLIEAAGPIVRRAGNSITIFTNRLMVRFQPETTLTQAEELLNAEDLKIKDQLTFAPNLYLVEADSSVGEEINEKAKRLSNSRLVVYAEPNLAEVPELDTIIPQDYLWPGTWDRRLVNVQDAWQKLKDSKGESFQFGDPNIILAVVDQGIKSVGGIPENPDFQGLVSNGSTKVYKLFDFQQMVDHNDDPLGDHGVACTGVASAIANNFEPGSEVGIGTSGAAPNIRLVGLIFPNPESQILEMYSWAAGLKVKSSRPNFPANLEIGVDVFTCSIGFGSGMPLSNSAKDMFDLITTRGRNGKGCLALFSAGNDNVNVENFRPYGTYERSFSCAASTLDSTGTEIRAPYSGWGKVAWCAPSNSNVPVFHNPPHSYGTWSVSFLSKGNLPSFPRTSSLLTATASAGDTSVKVNNVTGFTQGRFILVGEPGQTGSESVKIVGVPDHATNKIPVSPLANNHNVGEEVVGGENNNKNNFGGTSSATPLCAGICSLVLSAQPDLTWVEVREILRSTAIKFDITNTDPIGRWLDINGRPSMTTGLPPRFSKWYGYGRLDADSAVAAAIAYTFPRDLMIRKNLADDGEHEIVTSVDDSPDIWVRNADPSLDPSAHPINYDTAGPHQTPSRTTPRWIYARIRNRGTQASLDAWVRFYIASLTGAPFVQPDDWQPQNSLHNISAVGWERGTYLIGEVALPDIAPGQDIIVDIPWPNGLIPPSTTPAGDPWNPCLLVEVTPHDGPLKGRLVKDNNNLAQKIITIVN